MLQQPSITKELRTININNDLRLFTCRKGNSKIAACFAVFTAIFILSACNPKAIPTVIFPAKPEPVTAPVIVTEPAIATVNIFARDIVNPDTNGLASPVQVRVYLTTDQTLFERVSFEQVFEFEGNTFDLKPKLIQTIQPGSVASVKFKLPEEPSTVVVAAAFHDIGKTDWLEKISVVNHVSQNMNFILSDFTVTGD